MDERFDTRSGARPTFSVTKKAAKRLTRSGKPVTEFGGKRPTIKTVGDNDERRCIATTNSGTRCARWAAPGKTLCAKHGGGPREVPKVGRGRSMFDPGYHPRYTIEYMKDGLSLAEVCSKFGINPGTFEKWCKQYQILMDAWNEGLVHAEAYWVGMVRDNLNNRAFNDRLFSMYMVNRFNWNSGKTKQTVDLQAKVSGVLVAPAEAISVSDWAKQVEEDGQAPALEYDNEAGKDDESSAIDI